VADKEEKKQKPKRQGTFSQMKQVYQMTKKSDPNIGWILLFWSALTLLVFVAVGVLLNNWITLLILGVAAAAIVAMLILSRRAQNAAFTQIEGQPGRSGAAMNSVRRGWIVEEQPVAANRHQDLVFRGLGKPGIVLVTEGPSSRVQNLVRTEKKHLNRVVPGVPVHVIETGHDENQVELKDVVKTMNKLPKTLTQKEMPDVLYHTPRVGITYFTFNENIEPLNNVNVRKAISMAINRQEIIDSLLGGVATIENGIFPRGLIGYNSSLPELKYDPDGAKALLAEAGYPNGFDMEISVDSSSSDTTKTILEVISSQLSEVGINAEIKNYDESTWLATRKDGTLGSFMSTWTADYNDPDNFIYTFFGNENNTKQRSINYSDKAVMDRVSAARTIVNTEERIAEYNELEKKIVSEDCAWLPMFSKEHYYGVSKNIEGFKPNWAGISDMRFVGFSKK